MTATRMHNGMEFTITVVSFPNAHVATVTAADADVPVRKVMRDRPSAQLALEMAINWIERTF